MQVIGLGEWERVRDIVRVVDGEGEGLLNPEAVSGILISGLIM